MKIYSKIRIFENSTREFIKNTLIGIYADDWLEKGLGTDDKVNAVDIMEK